MGEPCKAGNVLFHGGGGDVAVVVSGGGLVSEATASLGSGVYRGSLCSSMSSLTDDDSESSPVVVGARAWSSSSSDTMLQLDGDGGGPLYELSPLLAHLPGIRTGLSKYYRGKSQSFTSLSDAKCVDDLAKKTIPYSSRMKAHRGCAASGPDTSHSSVSLHVPGPYSRMISKKTMPWGSSDRLLSRARSTGLLHRSGKPSAYQSKKEMYSTNAR